MQEQTKTLDDLRTAPNYERGYKFENVKTGEVSVFSKLREGVKTFYGNDNLMSQYQTIYSALYTRKHKYYYRHGVKVQIVSLNEYL